VEEAGEEQLLLELMRYHQIQQELAVQEEQVTYFQQLDFIMQEAVEAAVVKYREMVALVEEQMELLVAQAETMPHNILVAVVAVVV